MTTSPPPPPDDDPANPQSTGTPEPVGGYPPPPPVGGYSAPPPVGGYSAPPPVGGYSAPPPPVGGYPAPPPPAGGYPPPPPRGYPVAPTGAEARPPIGYAAPTAFEVGPAFTWAWHKFSKNVAALIVPTIVYLVIASVIVGATVFAVSTSAVPGSCDVNPDTGIVYCTTPEFGAIAIVALIVGAIVLLLALAAFNSAYLSGILAIADGRQVSIGDFFKPRNLASVLAAGVLIFLATAVGSLCGIGGIFVAVFSLFAFLIAVDRNAGPIAAIKASIDLAKNHFGDTFIAYLLGVLTVAVGALACLIGVLVSGPVAQLLIVYAYRKLSGGQVAPLTPA